MGSSRRYHRLALVHAHRAHDPGSMTLIFGAGSVAGSTPAADAVASSAKVTTVISLTRAPLSGKAECPRDGVLAIHVYSIYETHNCKVNCATLYLLISNGLPDRFTVSSDNKRVKLDRCQQRVNQNFSVMNCQTGLRARDRAALDP